MDPILLKELIELNNKKIEKRKKEIKDAHETLIFSSVIIIFLVYINPNNQLWITILLALSTMAITTINKNSSFKSKQILATSPLLLIFNVLILIAKRLGIVDDLFIVNTSMITFGCIVGMILLSLNEKYLKNKKEFGELEFLFWISITFFTLSLTMPMTDWLIEITDLLKSKISNPLWWPSFVILPFILFIPITIFTWIFIKRSRLVAGHYTINMYKSIMIIVGILLINNLIRNLFTITDSPFIFFFTIFTYLLHYVFLRFVKINNKLKAEVKYGRN